jgi:hypothetical protein
VGAASFWMVCQDDVAALEILAQGAHLMPNGVLHHIQ